MIVSFALIVVFTLGKFALWVGTAGAALMRGWGTVDAAVAQFFLATWSLIIISMKTVLVQRISDVSTRLLLTPR